MIERIKELGKPVVLERNEILPTTGVPDSHVYLIDNGSVKIQLLQPNGEEQIIRFGYAGNVFVLLDSFLSDRVSIYQVQAIKRTVLLKMSKEQLNHWIDENESHARWWIKTLEDLVLQQMEREVDLLTHAPKERYERVLKRSPRLFQEIPNKHIANYLRMTPETLSRLKKS